MEENVKEKCRTCLTEGHNMVSVAADHVASEKVIPVFELIMLCSSVQVYFIM